MTLRHGERKLGTLLLERQIINAEQLNQVTVTLRESSRRPPLAQLLLELQLTTSEQLEHFYLREFNIEPLREKPQIHPEASELLDMDVAIEMQIVPLMRDGKLALLTADPASIPSPRALMSDLNYQGSVPEILSGTPARVHQMLSQHWPESHAEIWPGMINQRPLEVADQVILPSELSAPPPKVTADIAPLTEVPAHLKGEERDAWSLAQSLNLEFADELAVPTPEALNSVPEKTAKRYTLIPLSRTETDLKVIMHDPLNVFALDDLSMITGLNITPVVAPLGRINKLLERGYGSQDMQTLAEELQREQRSRTPQAKTEETDILDDNAVVQTVDAIIREAALQDVSDIHVEPSEHDLTVRYRIDGVLREHMRLPRAASQSLLARIKIIGHLDISERRIPQDGRIRFKRGSIDLDLRLSTLPTVYGEKAVMRLLKKASDIPELEQLGLSEHNYQKYLDTIHKPNGIFLVTGPTGSGKSFTSFSTLKRIAQPHKNTTTIEDPVEYEIPGIVQSQVNNTAGMTFARALRAFLRQDPDIIFVGEIRDQETAKIAVEAALTGHLVLATLHTNDAPGAVTRLEEMGLEPFNIAAAVVGVVAQRLVRRVCRDCAAPTNADPDVLRRLGITEQSLSGATLMRGSGCARCSGTGYRGRMGIHELMVMDDALRRSVSTGQGVEALKQEARQSGMLSLREDGILKAAQGVTTLEEILAVTSH